MQDKTKVRSAPFWNQHTEFQRNNYYFGKLMTVRDFSDEQRYLNEKRWMLNRYGIGWGVVCGLNIRPHSDPDAREKVIVEPGFALDPYGHEIMVYREHEVDLRTVRDEPPADTPHLYYILLYYEECLTEQRPVPVEECGEYQEECVHNRTRETYRFEVVRQKPEFTNILDSDLRDILPCETECFRFLEDPAQVMSEQCADRPECAPIPIGCVCYNPDTPTSPVDIDISPSNRKLAYSNEVLYEFIRCLREEDWLAPAAHLDRRRHVPLLASTIPGLTYQDGKIARLDRETGLKAVHPYRLTTDGEYIWMTDREAGQIWRVDRRTNHPIEDEQLVLEMPSWGIAYDGRDMWVTHHDYRGENQDDTAQPAYGTLTRINACTLERWTLDRLPREEDLPECQRFPESLDMPEPVMLPPLPGEVVLHRGHIYVAHAHRRGVDSPEEERERRREEAVERRRTVREEMRDNVEIEEARTRHPERETGWYTLSISRIDPGRGCLVEVVEIPREDLYAPASEIIAMASDGEALWLTYDGQLREAVRDRRIRPVVRKITLNEEGNSVVHDPFELDDGTYPEDMAFDGTHLWVTHNDGASRINLETTRNFCAMGGGGRGGEVALTAIGFGGQEHLWAAEIGHREARVNRINIYSGQFDSGLEIVEFAERNAEYEISDIQFDGTYIYVAAAIQEEGQEKQGIIHRLLP